MIQLLLIGNGKFGKNYVSTLSNFSNVSLTIANRQNWQSLIDKKPDGVMICTPPQSHIEIAEYSLNQNIPTMIEKPLSLSYQEAIKLQQYKAPILVNHIYLFSQAYQQLKKIIDPYKIDKITSLGFNKGPIRDYSSLWDYGCHDLSMILDLAQDFPNNINCQEAKTQFGSLFKIKLDFQSFIAESLVGNGASKKNRKLKVECDGIKYVYDDLYRPNNHILPLENALITFINAIKGKDDDRLGLYLSLQVIKVLEQCLL